MKKTKRTLFTFSAYEYKGVEEYLNRQAAQGWELVKVGLFSAKFRATDRTDLKYCTDLLSYRRRSEGRERQREYLELCREGGWELVDRAGHIGIFASLPGTDPAPIQTDPDTEWYSYQRAYRNSLFWSVVAILPVVLEVVLLLLLARNADIAVGESLVRAFRFNWTRSWIAAAFYLALPIFFVTGLWKLGDFWWNWSRTRRAGTIHTPARWAMWANGAANLAGWLALMAVSAGGVAETIQRKGPVSSLIGLAIGGVIIFFWPSFTYEDEVYPREYRRMRIYGAAITILCVLIIAANLRYGGDTVNFWRDNSDFSEHYARLEDVPVVREMDYGVQPEGAYTFRQGVGPAGSYAILMNDLNQEMNASSCSRYDCYTGWLAKCIMETLKDEAERAGKGTARVGSQIWTIWDYNASTLERVEIPWADEVWYGAWSTNDAAQSSAKEGTVLVLRGGNTVVRICAQTDLLDEDTLEAIQIRLGF